MKLPDNITVDIKFDTAKANKNVAELTKKVEQLGLAFEKYRNIELTYTISEAKPKKWYQFWK